MSADPGIRLSHTALQGFTVKCWSTVEAEIRCVEIVEAVDPDAIALIADTTIEDGDAATEHTAVLASGGNGYLVRNIIDGGTGYEFSFGVWANGGSVWAYDNEISGGFASVADDCRGGYVTGPTSWIRVYGCDGF